MTPKAEETKVKTDKLNYIKIRNFCASKDTTVKRQPMEWKNIFVNHVSDKGFISRICK